MPQTTSVRTIFLRNGGGLVIFLLKLGTNACLYTHLLRFDLVVWDFLHHGPVFLLGINSKVRQVQNLRGSLFLVQDVLQFEFRVRRHREFSIFPIPCAVPFPGSGRLYFTEAEKLLKTFQF